MSIGLIVTHGYGNGTQAGTIAGVVLRGYSNDPRKYIALTLEPRSNALTLQARSTSLTLEPRN